MQLLTPTNSRSVRSVTPVRGAAVHIQLEPYVDQVNRYSGLTGDFAGAAGFGEATINFGIPTNQIPTDQIPTDQFSGMLRIESP